MRIFQSIEATANAAIANNKTWYRNLYEPLIEMGHEVVLFDAYDGRRAYNQNNRSLREKFSQLMLDKFMEEHKRSPFDLFFSYFIDGMIEPEIVNRIREVGVPTCNFSCNNSHQFHLIREISPYFDFNLHAERNAKKQFHTIGAKPYWFPMASNPKYFKPLDVTRTIKASFVGANYANRARYIHYLLSNGIDVHAYGPGWRGGAKNPLRSTAKRYYYLFKNMVALTPQAQSRASSDLAEHDFRRNLSFRYPENVHFPISDDALIRLYSESHLSLGFLEVFFSHDSSAATIQHLHLREFEAPMCGALYCTGFTSELAEHFEPEKEVITYRNVYEMLDKIQYYLAHPSAAERVRQAGRTRALAEHTYHHRYRMLFKHLRLKGE